MRNSILPFLFVVVLCSTIDLHAQPLQWVTAYYKGWSQGWFDNGVLPAEQIDYSAVTHIVHFAVWPNADGTLDTNANGIRFSNSAVLISNAHAAGVKVLISVGGSGSSAAFRIVTNLPVMTTLVNNIVAFIQQRGYDGVDIDWEAVEQMDSLQYVTFIQALSAALHLLSPRPLLSASAVGVPSIFAAVSDRFDQINVITYDLSWSWPGWVVWHNSPIYDGGVVFPSNGLPVPSADGLVRNFLAAGVPAGKMAIGVDFYGYIWSGGGGTSTGGVTRPGQTWTTSPSVQINALYSDIMTNYYKPEYYRWDSAASAAYLSIDMPDSANDKFISYDNEQTCRAKVEYVRQKGLGGIFIWELGGGVFPEGYVPRQPLIQALKSAVETDVSQIDSTAPQQYSLQQNYPNPFNPRTTFRFGIANAGFVRLKIYDVIGREVATLVHQRLMPGMYTQTWDASNAGSGVYFYRLDVQSENGSAKFSSEKKMLLVK